MNHKAILSFEPQSLFLSHEQYQSLMRENFERLNAKLGHREAVSSVVVIDFGPEEEITEEEELPTDPEIIVG